MLQVMTFGLRQSNSRNRKAQQMKGLPAFTRRWSPTGHTERTTRKPRVVRNN